MSILDTVRRNLGSWTGRLVVLAMFVGVPVAVWWIASPQVATLPIEAGYRGLMSTMIFASVAFGLTTAVLVWRDLANEP